MPRSTRSTNPIESNSSNLSDLYKDIQHRAHSEALKNNMSGNSGDGDDVTRHNNRPGGQLTGTLNPEKNGNNQQPPLGFNMEQLQTIINDMIQNAILNFANKNQVPPANAATIAQFHPTAASTNETGNVLSQINGNETRQFLPTITDRVTSVIMPDKFTVKDNFSKWEIKFNSYCRMNRIKEEDKLDTLILLLDNTVLQEIYDNPLLRNNYQQLTLYLSENFNGGISIQAATDELELLVGKRVQKPDDLDHVAKKIDRYIDIKFPCDSRERKNREKLMYLAKTLPSAIQNSYFCSSKNTLDEGVAIAKKIWIQEIRAERDKARGFSIIKSHKPTDKNQRYQRNNSSQYCSYCKMNNHTNATCRNKNRVKGQSNNIEVTENQVNNIEVSKDLLPSMNINKLEEHLPTNEVSFDKLNDSPPNMNLDDSWNYVTYKNKNNKKLKESPSTVNIVEQPLSKNASTTKSHVNVPAENMSIDESHNKVSCLNINVDRSANNVSLINMNNNQSPEKLSCINTNVNESPINVSHMNTNLDESDKLEKPLPQNQSFRETLHKISTKDNLIGAVVKINDVNVISLIDTGSNCLIISNKLKDKLNLVTCNESQISTYQSSNAAYKIETPITIQIQKESFTLTDNIYAAKENFKNDSYDAIIGTNILKRLMAVIDLQTGKIIMNKNKKPVHVENQSPTTNVILGNQDDNVNINEFVDKLKLKYPLAYAKHAFDIGPGKIVVNEIEIYENKEMIKAPYYSVPIHEKDSISQLLNCWIENGLLEKSSSNLIHPIMLITKNNDKNDFESRRFIADLRQVNSITKPVNYNTPKIQELLQSLNAFSFITKIDLKSAFFQLSLPENSRKLYGIRTPIGNLQFKRLPQGGKVSSAIFQRTMEEVFQKLRNNCLIYCDDILLYSTGTLLDHEHLIHQFMEICNNLELKVSLEKSVFFAREAKFLGYHITSQGSKPDISNVNSILQRDVPKRKKQCISFLQAINYFRNVIPNFSRTAAPLYEVSKGRDGPITLNEEQLQCYHTLRQQLMNSPTMHHPIHGLPFLLTTDSSNHTIGAILSQNQNGTEVPLSFFSCRLSPTKRARSPTFLELFAVAKSLQHYKYLLSSAEVIIRTDHKPLLHLSTSNNDKKYLELLETINQFNVKLTYISGKSNIVADWLSRLCNSNPASPTANTIQPISLTTNSTIQHIKTDNENNITLKVRRRGRPKKKSMSSSDTSNIFMLKKKSTKTNLPLITDSTNIPKRGRGRPRKNPVINIDGLDKLSMNNNNKSNLVNTDLSNLVNHDELEMDDDVKLNIDENKLLKLVSNKSTLEDKNKLKLDDTEVKLDAATELMLMSQLTDLDLISLQREDKKCQEGVTSGRYDNHTCFKDTTGLIKVKLSGEESKELIVIPEKAIEPIFRFSHNFNGHYGFLKTKDNINKSCYVSGLAKKLADYLSRCHVCKLRNTVSVQHGPAKIVLPVPVMDEISIDFLGPLTTPGSKKQRFILNVIDTGSRFVIPIPMMSQMHEEVMYHLMNDVFLRFGFPKKIRCDNAQNFKANSLKELLSKLNIQIEYSTPQYSQSNSICERYLRTLQSGVNKLIATTGRDWDLYIPYLAYVYNSNVIKSFNMSPFQLMYARPPTTTLDLFLRSFNIGLHDRETDIYEMMERAQISRDIAGENHLQARLHTNNYSKPPKDYKVYSKNDLVYIKNKKRKGKFDNVYDGPYKVLEDLNSKIKYKGPSGRSLIASKTNLRT